MRGMGRIFKRGSVYWIANCYRGKEHRESAHSGNEAQARKLLKKRVGEMGQGRLIGPSEERLTFEDLREHAAHGLRGEWEAFARVCETLYQPEFPF